MFYNTQHVNNMESTSTAASLSSALIKLEDIVTETSNRKDRRRFQKKTGIKIKSVNIPYVKKLVEITR